MIRALRTAATGMYAQQMYIDTIANNLANVNTSAFKKSKIEFQDLMYETIPTAEASTAGGATAPTILQVGHGTRPSAIQKMFAQGNISPTDNPLDLAINGNGFFQVVRPDGTTAYTRDGSFKLSAEGNIVSSDGFSLASEITIPTNTNSIRIGADGTVSVMITGQTAAQNVGQIELARFVNPAGLKNMGRNLYEATESSGEAITGAPSTEGLGTLSQGYLEASNVKVVEEMINMIMAQRAYEINARAIKTVEDMMSVANNIQR